MRLTPDLILGALVVGVAAGHWLDWWPSSAAPLLLLALAAIGLAVGFRLFGLPAGPVLLACALLFGVWRAESAATPSLPLIPTGSNVTATVQIMDAPVASGGRYRFRARVVSDPDDAPNELPAGANLLAFTVPPDALTSQRNRPFLRYGDRLRLTGNVERPEPIGDFDYAAWLEAQGIVGVMWSRQSEVVAVGGGSRLAGGLHGVRTSLASAIQRSIQEPASGLAQALLLGIRSDLPQPVKESFRAAGMSHLLAISGLHVGIAMALTLTAASTVVGRNHPLAVAAAALVVWSYAILSGLDPPVARAAIMGSFYLAQGLMGRGTRGLTALLLAAALMVLVDPTLPGSLSFQLSFTAMAGVIVGLPLIATLNAAIAPPLSASGSWLGRWARHALSLLAASAVISTTTTLATMPLVAWHFGEIPLMSVPATILAMPAMPAALLGAAATSALGVMAPPLAVVLGALTWAPLAWLMWVADAMPPVLLSAPWLTVPVATAWLGGLGMLAVLASSRRARRATAALRRRPRWRPRRSGALLASAIPVMAVVALLLFGAFASARPDGLLHVYALDVGQGDAIFVVTPEGRRALVDGGPDSETTLAAVASLMPPGSRSLDVVAATHLDSDHVGGLLGALDRYRVGVALHTGDSPVDSALGPQWQAVLRAREHPTAVIHAGHRIQLGREVTLEALYPPPEGLPAGVDQNANNGSMTLRLEHGAVSFLLTGDLEVDAERHLASVAGDGVSADVLKVGHHGSRTSTTQSFLNLVNPRSAVISAGRDNRYGHPHPDVMRRLEASVGADHVFLTARDGTVEYVSDGKNLWVKTHGVTER